MSIFKCGNCGFVGHCYGTPILAGDKSAVSAPHCYRCGVNNQLTPLTDTLVETEEPKGKRGGTIYRLFERLRPSPTRKKRHEGA